jgi:hypothetical protein
VTGPEIEQRKGDVLRVTQRREVAARCLICGFTTGNAGQAWGHVRSTRHALQLSYSATYVYVPGESCGGEP